MEFKKEDNYMRTFTGTTYERPHIKTVGELRSWLEWIVEDLPEDELKISEVTLHNGELDYTLSEGIVQ